jgi:hypothetical protein
MASNAWNRYFQSRSAHTTNDSMFAPDSGRLPLNQLGEDDILINLSDEEQQALAAENGSSNESAADEPLNYELMTQSNPDYFQVTYYFPAFYCNCKSTKKNRQTSEFILKMSKLKNLISVCIRRNFRVRRILTK